MILQMAEKCHTHEEWEITVQNYTSLNSLVFYKALQTWGK